MFWKKKNQERARTSSVESGPEPDPARRTALRTLGLIGTGATLAPLASGCELLPGHEEESTVEPFSLALEKPYVPGAERYGTFEERWINTSCGQCPAGCGIRVRVVEGRAVRIEGNAKNPINRGGIGPRGLASLQALYDPDRIRTPLVRKDGRLVPIGWREAERLIVSKLAALRSRGEPEKLLVMSGKQRGFGLELWARFCKAYGSPNLVDGRPSRTAVLTQAMGATLGHEEIPAFDWVGAQYVISFEAGLLEDSCQAVYFVRAAGEIRRGRTGHRAKLVHAGPSFDLSAHNADEWVQIHPGTGGMLALGICHVLARDNLYDGQFVSRSTGFEAFQQSLERFTPDSVAAATGTTPEVIVKIARELGENAGKSFAFMDERTLAFANGWETAVAVLNLNAMLGAPQRATAGLLLEPRPPYADWPEVELDGTAREGLAHPRLDLAGTPRYELARSIHETLPDAISRDPPSVLLLHYANPAYARVQPKRWRDALKKIPFIVSFSPYMDESVSEVAHLVLPDNTALERWDDAGSAPGVGLPVAGVRRPAVEPLFDTRPTGDVIISVAQALGDTVAAAFPWRSFRGAMEERLMGLFAARRGSIVEPTERAFLTRLYDEGFWVDDQEPPAPLPVQFQFKVEHPEMPEWSGDPREFPLKLIVFRPLGYAEGSGANQPWLRFLRARPDSTYWSTPATLHPDTAPEGLEDGAHLEVTSEWGTIRVPARFDESMMRGYVAIPEGGGHTAWGRWAKGYGANPMHLLKPGPARHSGAGMLCNTRVRLRAAPPYEPEEGQS